MLFFKRWHLYLNLYSETERFWLKFLSFFLSFPLFPLSLFLFFSLSFSLSLLFPKIRIPPPLSLSSLSFNKKDILGTRRKDVLSRRTWILCCWSCCSIWWEEEVLFSFFLFSLFSFFSFLSLFSLFSLSLLFLSSLSSLSLLFPFLPLLFSNNKKTKKTEKKKKRKKNQNLT